MKLNKNYVLVEIDDSNQWLDLGKEKIKIDTTFEPERRAQQVGKVIDIGEIDFHYEPLCLSWNTECEISIGDKVLFHYLSVNGAIKNGRMLSPTQIILRYDDIFCVITGGVKPVNGWVFVEPMQEEIVSAIQIPDHLKKKKSNIRGIVKHLGKPVGYGTEGECHDCINVSVGDEIIFAPWDAIPVQDELRPIVGNVYRMHRVDILAVTSKLLTTVV